MEQAVQEQPRVATLEKVRALESVIKELPKEDQIDWELLTSHHFCEGVYAREFFLPAGTVAVGKMHAKESFFLLVMGDATISTEGGVVQRIRAPYMAVTQPGSKRVVFAHEDTLFLTFHPNPDDERDMERLEARYIIPEALPAPEKHEELT